MPTMNNVLVTTQANIATGSGKGPRLVRIKQNGWLVAAVLIDRRLSILISKDGGQTFEEKFFVYEGYPYDDYPAIPLTITSFDMAFINKRLLLLVAVNDASRSYGNDLHLFDFSLVDGFWHQRPGPANIIVGGYKSLDRCSIEVNGDGSEVHVAFSAVSTTYRPTPNIFYTKATRNGGSWNWAFPTAITKLQSDLHKFMSPTVLVNESGNPVIVYEEGNNFVSGTNGSYFLYVTVFQNGAWTPRYRIFSKGFARSSDKYKPEAIFIPRAVNGRDQGRMFVAWAAGDLDVPSTNVAVVHSDDGGLTWSWYTQLSSGSDVYSENVALGADKSGKVFATLESWKYDNRDIRMATFNGTSWNTAQNRFATANTVESDAVPLIDFGTTMTRAVVLYKRGNSLYIDGAYTNSMSITPLTQDLGLLADPPAPSYTITSDTPITEIELLLDEDEIGTVTNPTSLTRTAVITQEVWRAIPYWKRHRLDVVARDSGGETVTATFWFAKKLRGNEPLSEIIRASNDAKDYITLKRDRIAVQVGLPAGSTFDEISDHLDNEEAAGTKRASGVMSNVTARDITVRSLDFRPSKVTIVVAESDGRATGFAYYADQFYAESFEEAETLAFYIDFIQPSVPFDATFLYGGATMYNDGFYLTFRSSGGSGVRLEWFAEE